MSAVDVSRQESSVIRVTKHVVKRHPIKVSFYIIGLLCLFFNGFEVTDVQWEKHDALINSNDYILAKKQVESLQNEIIEKNYHLGRVKGWFSCNIECQSVKSSLSELKQQLVEVKTIEQNIKSQAISHLGLFSTYSVKNLKSLFFDKFNSGKDAALNRSFWDLIFVRMYRDEDLGSYILRVIFNIVFNFLLGMFMAFITFSWSVISFIQSYRPGYIEGVVFFVLATTTAAVFIVSWIAIFGASIGGTVYVVGNAVVKNAAIEDQRRRHHVKYD